MPKCSIHYCDNPAFYRYWNSASNLEMYRCWEHRDEVGRGDSLEKNLELIISGEAPAWNFEFLREPPIDYKCPICNGEGWIKGVAFVKKVK